MPFLPNTHINIYIYIAKISRESLLHFVLVLFFSLFFIVLFSSFCFPSWSRKKKIKHSLCFSPWACHSRTSLSSLYCRSFKASTLPSIILHLFRRAYALPCFWYPLYTVFFISQTNFCKKRKKTMQNGEKGFHFDGIFAKRPPIVLPNKKFIKSVSPHLHNWYPRFFSSSPPRRLTKFLFFWASHNYHCCISIAQTRVRRTSGMMYMHYLGML